MSTKNNASKINTKESLLRLMEQDYIQIYEDANCTVTVGDVKPANTYFIKTTDKSNKSVNNGKEMYAKIFHSDLKKIMSVDSNYKSHVFSVYHAIIGCVKYDKVDSNGKVIIQQSDRMAYPSIETIAERTGLNRKTVMGCLEILHESGIICTLTVRVEAKKDRNFYCRWVYKDLIKEWVSHQLRQINKEHEIMEGILEINSLT